MTDTAQQAVDAAYALWIEAAMAGNAEAYAGFFGDEGVLMPPNAPPVRGREAIRAWSRQFFSTYQLEVETYSMEHQIVSDALAVSRYTAAGTYRPIGGGDGVPFDQKYFDLLVKEADGSWRMRSHMWSSNDNRTGVWK